MKSGWYERVTRKLIWDNAKIIQHWVEQALDLLTSRYVCWCSRSGSLGDSRDTGVVFARLLVHARQLPHLFKSTASDSSYDSLAPRLFWQYFVRALRTRSGLQTRGQSLKPNPKPQSWFSKRAIYRSKFRKGVKEPVASRESSLQSR